MSVRAALFLDFDNMFGGLLKLDPVAAKAAAQRPHAWVERLARRHLLGGERRFLVRRCYLNPAGNTSDPLTGERYVFSDFRPFFTRAGFEVIDCPTLAGPKKNAADIRIALDVIDAAAAPISYDEFVIASSDADFTPLLQRLRALDRRTTLLSTLDAAEALEAMADQVIDARDLIPLLTTDEARGLAVPASSGHERFRRYVNDAYAGACAPINLSRLSQELRGEFGAEVDATNWFGAGSFGRAIAALELENVAFSQHHMWDTGRHPSP